MFHLNDLKFKYKHNKQVVYIATSFLENVRYKKKKFDFNTRSHELFKLHAKCLSQTFGNTLDTCKVSKCINKIKF